MSSVYMGLLIFLLAILIPACASSSLAAHMIYFVNKLSKQGESMQPWRTTFLMWNQSVLPCSVLTVASWPAYRFLRALGSIATNKAHGGDGIPVQLFQIPKEEAVKALHSICQQIWKTQQQPQDWKNQFSFQSQRKSNEKNVQTTEELLAK